MKLIKAFIHHVRTAPVVEALADAGYRNLTLHDVKGMLKPITENEQEYSTEAGSLVISEVRLSLVVEDQDVDEVTAIIRKVGRVGPHISGYVYVSSVEQALPIGGPE
ncbi:MAG: P-II family nitrogen regulator [Gammaproteobacteria bacterium]|nr:P-II family nitrogen regulator [Gammaproteobacteria bacterium]